jgi:hypothetical protein
MLKTFSPADIKAMGKEHKSLTTLLETARFKFGVFGHMPDFAEKLGELIMCSRIATVSLVDASQLVNTIEFISHACQLQETLREQGWMFVFCFVGRFVI